MTDFTKTMQMGIGEAIQRLLKVELLLQRGIALVPEETRAERQLIIDALNTHKLDLGFDCNLDGMPDTVEIFAKSAETSCCKIVNSDTSRSARPASSRRRAAQKDDAASKAAAKAAAEADALMRAAAEAAAQAEADAQAEAEALEEAMRAAEAAEAAAAAPAEDTPKKPARGGSRRRK